MAKSKSRSRRGANVSVHRYQPVHSPRIIRVVPRFSVSPLSLSLIEDRRFYRPEPTPLRPVFSITSRSAARIVAKQNPRYKPDSQTKAILAFAEPDVLPLCIRRKRRKQVLHAKGIAGSRGLRPPRRNSWSEVSCT